MVYAQAMTLAVMQAAIEVTKAVVQVMAVAKAEACTRMRNKAVSVGSRSGGPSLKIASFK